MIDLTELTQSVVRIKTNSATHVMISDLDHAGYVLWLRRIQPIMSRIAHTREHRLALLSALLGKEVASTKELTIAEIQAILAVWDACPDDLIAFAYSLEAE